MTKKREKIKIVSDKDFEALIFGGPIPEKELLRRRRAAMRLKKKYSHLEFYKDWTLDDWYRFHGSQINTNG